MDKRFLDKVIDQIVSETKIDYRMGKVQFPFIRQQASYPAYSLSLLRSPNFTFSSTFILALIKQCIEVYGLNMEEVEYVCDEYKEIIIDEINNG